MIKRKNLDEEIYGILMRMILDGQYRMGQKISIEEIEKELGVSRTPILGALSKLAHDGFLQTQRGTGFFAPSFTERDYDEIVEGINLLAMEAFERIMKDDSQDYINRLRRLADVSDDVFRTGDISAYFRADIDFHVEIVKYMDNRRLTEYFQKLFTQLCFFYQLSIEREQNPNDVLHPESHHIFCDLLEKKDRDSLYHILIRDFSKSYINYGDPVGVRQQTV